jgi:flagellar assembly protein FliH
MGKLIRNAKVEGVFKETIEEKEEEKKEVDPLLLTKQRCESLLSEAKREAEKIVAEAKREKESLILEAIKEAEEIKKKSYEEGYAKGRKEGFESAKKEFVSLLNSLAEAIEEVRKSEEEYFNTLFHSNTEAHFHLEKVVWII